MKRGRHEDVDRHTAKPSGVARSSTPNVCSTANPPALGGGMVSKRCPR